MDQSGKLAVAPGAVVVLADAVPDQGGYMVAIVRPRVLELQTGYPAPVPMSATQRSEEHTSELQSLMRISYAVFCLKNKKHHTNTTQDTVDYTQRHSMQHLHKFITHSYTYT